jgi:hypothetical protein
MEAHLALRLKSTISALAPSVFKGPQCAQLATGSAGDKSQHKIWLNDVAPLNMPSKSLGRAYFPDRQVLIEGSSILKHLTEVSHIGNIPNGRS